MSNIDSKKRLDNLKKEYFEILMAMTTNETYGIKMDVIVAKQIAISVFEDATTTLMCNCMCDSHMYDVYNNVASSYHKKRKLMLEEQPH